jgi:hypothetical protein
LRNENLGSERWPPHILSSNWGGFAEQATKSAVWSITAVYEIFFDELCVDYKNECSHLILNELGALRISPLANLKV